MATLRSHFDDIRGVYMSSVDPILCTISEVSNLWFFTWLTQEIGLYD